MKFFSKIYEIPRATAARAARLSRTELSRTEHTCVCRLSEIVVVDA
jgi:hypothetical protein